MAKKPAPVQPRYQVLYGRKARKFLDWLADRDEAMHDKVYAACEGLSTEPRPTSAIKIQPKQVQRYRLESRPYRAIYEIDDGAGVVTILDIDHRKQVYR